jgi:hypothetical protein
MNLLHIRQSLVAVRSGNYAVRRWVSVQLNDGMTRIRVEATSRRVSTTSAPRQRSSSERAPFPAASRS